MPPSARRGSDRGESRKGGEAASNQGSHASDPDDARGRAGATASLVVSARPGEDGRAEEHVQVEEDARVARLAHTLIPGDGEVVLRRVASGAVNTVFRAERSGATYSLRIADGGQRAPGVDRDWECRVLRAAGAASLAPPVVYCDPQQGVLVTRWAEGAACTAEHWRGEPGMQALVRLLKGVHALCLPEPRRVMRPAQWVTYYREARVAAPMIARKAGATAGDMREAGIAAARRAELSDAELARAADARLAELAVHEPATPVPCHGDLHRANLVAGDPPLLLDWEYSHCSDPWWDLAGWIAGEEWPEPAARALLERYLEREPTAAESARLQRLVWVYDYVCLSWIRLCSPRARSAEAAGLAVRAAALAARLSRDA